MPGPTSDSYDPEFGTGDNAYEVAHALREVVARITDSLGEHREYIVDVARGQAGLKVSMELSERELRVIRFGLERALESI